MAKVTAPMLSFGGSGQIAKSIVFSTWRGVKYGRQYVVPANPATTGQQTTRTTFATLREMWKIMATDGRAPWDAFAQGRKFLGLNKFVGENLRVVRAEPDFNNFLGSPGAKGGLPAASFIAATGAGSGEVTGTFVLPTIPSGWVHTGCVIVAFPDQDPALDFAGPLIVNAVAAPGLVCTAAGLGSNISCQVSGWITWTKPTGEVAYSVSETQQATSGV